MLLLVTLPRAVYTGAVAATVTTFVLWLCVALTSHAVVSSIPRAIVRRSLSRRAWLRAPQLPAATRVPTRVRPVGLAQGVRYADHSLLDGCVVYRRIGHE